MRSMHQGDRNMGRGADMTDDHDPTPPCDPAATVALPSPPADSPIYDLMFLLEWGRDRGFRIGPHVEIDGMRVQVADLRQGKIEGVVMPDAPGEGGGGSDIWRENGYEGEGG
jgi:hypothetical protein